MPIYEYICEKCNSKFDKLVRNADGQAAKIECPDCGSTETARTLSLFAVGAEQPKSSGGGCGRCGGPGPCAMG